MQKGTVIARCIFRCSRQFTSLTSPLNICRTFSTTTTNCLKEIQEVKTEDVTMVEGVQVVSDRAEHVLKVESPTSCPLCKHNLDLKYTDVLILSQFLRPDGCLLPRHVTGVCKKQQLKLEKLVHQAQRAGLLPTFRPDLRSGRTRTTVHSQYKWKKYNVYYADD